MSLLSDYCNRSSFKIDQLDKKRKYYEEKGAFREAEKCLRKIKQLNIEQGEGLRDDLLQEQRIAEQALNNELGLERENFEATWRQKMTKFEREAERLLDDAMERMDSELEQKKEEHRKKVMHRRPKFSTQVLQGRRHVRRLAKAGEYHEADELRSSIRQNEIQEIERFQSDLEQEYDSLVKQTQKRHDRELEVLEQRIERAYLELKQNRRSEREKMLKSQHNRVNEMHRVHKRELSKLDSQLSRYASALQSSKRKAKVDYKPVVESIGSLSERGSSAV
eukprot:gb/GECH01000744.1/.p1 GENE.gb/GECH01000744.1/~~gb/GECH01000744.1/.p1  ORF type:complete len:278 (+),score=68.18 gb/GECH01000744.1/:1-834(+)